MASDDKFFKQRKDLMIMSLVFLAVEIAGVKLTRLKLFDNEVEFATKNPWIIPFSLFVGTAYFLWRYYQYARIEYKVLKDAQHGLLGTPYQQRLELFLGKPALKKAATVQKGLKKSGYTMQPNVEIHKSSRAVGWKMREASFKHYRGEVVFVTKLGEARMGGSYEVSLNWWNLLLPRIKTFFWTIINMTSFTEFVLPVFLAVAALAVALRNHWVEIMNLIKG